MKHLKKSEYVLAGVLALVAAFPFVSEGVPAGMDTVLHASAVSETTIRQQALDSFSQYRSNRREYQKSQALCRTLIKSGKDIDCPDINDAAGIYMFLSTHETPDSVPAAAVAAIRTVNDLNAYQMNLMRRYQKLHMCPDSMKEYLPGFYELCQSLLTPAPVLRGIRTGPVGTATEDVTLEEIVERNRGVRRTW